MSSSTKEEFKSKEFSPSSEFLDSYFPVLYDSSNMFHYAVMVFAYILILFPTI